VVEHVAPALLYSHINNATETSPSSKQQGVASMGMQSHSTFSDHLQASDLLTASVQNIGYLASIRPACSRLLLHWQETALASVAKCDEEVWYVSSYLCRYALKGLLCSCVRGELCRVIHFAIMESVQISGELVMVSLHLDMRRLPSDR
jgi:hypothetical protein